jgi:putative ABC transport system permease protein
MKSIKEEIIANHLITRIIVQTFAWFCPSSLYESIEGDLLEQFEEDVKLMGEKKAKRKFIWNMLKFFRLEILLRNRFSFGLNQGYMIKNNFISAYRHLVKNKEFSIINILGLAVGMTAFLLIIHYVRFERSYEDFHKNSNNIVRVTLDIYKESEFVVSDCGMYSRIGPLLKEQFPEVQDFTRLCLIGKRVVSVSNKKFYEGRMYFTDPSIFKLFSFSIIDGTPDLSNPFQVVITKFIALKYFGRAAVAGESIEIEKKIFKITGVIDDVPANTHLKFDLLLSHSTMAKFWDYEENGYNGNNELTYLLLGAPVNIAQLNEKLKNLSIALKDNIGDDLLVAQPMKDIHLYSNKSYEAEPNGNAQSVYFLIIVAAFILCIAWINYINLCTAKAVERAKEVGIRKVMGSQQLQLVFQFLSESIILTLLASVLSIVLAYSSLPLFIYFTGQELSLTIFQGYESWYLFFGLLLVGSLLAGIYPAFVLSSFQPAFILKGRFQSSSRGQWLRKGLVVFQFSVTIILLVCMGAVYFQNNYLQKYKLGVNIEQTLVLRSPKIESDSIYSLKAQALKRELIQHPLVKMVSQSGTLPGSGDLSATGNILRPGQENNDKGYIYYINSFDENFIPQFQLELMAGTNFSGTPSDDNYVIINEETVNALGFRNAKEAVGSVLLFYNQKRTIVGVLKNFYQRSPKEKHIPMVFRYDKYADFVSVKIKANDSPEILEDVKSTWTKIFPDSPLDYFFLDEKFNQQYKSDIQFGKVIGLFSTLAALIACLGLFGLSSFTILQRTKEIGIRKVLGASVKQITMLVSKEFILIVLVANVIAWPISYFLMDNWLNGFANRINLGILSFLIPGSIALLIAILTVASQSIKAATADPVNSLKSE